MLEELQGIRNGDDGSPTTEPIAAAPSLAQPAPTRAEVKAAKQFARAQEIEDCRVAVMAMLEGADCMLQVQIVATYTNGAVLHTPQIQIVGK